MDAFQIATLLLVVIHANKAESLVINSVGQRPTKRNTHEHQALKGRNRNVALSGLHIRGCHSINRALPYPNDYTLSGHWLMRDFSCTSTPLNLCPESSSGFEFLNF